MMNIFLVFFIALMCSFGIGPLRVRSSSEETQSNVSHRTVVLSSSFGSGQEARLLPIAALSWRRQGWAPLILTVGEEWIASKLGRRILDEVARIPDSLVVHLANKSSAALALYSALFAAVLVKPHPESYFLVADPRLLVTDAASGIKELSNRTDLLVNKVGSLSNGSYHLASFRGSRNKSDTEMSAPYLWLDVAEQYCGAHKVGASVHYWTHMAESWLGTRSKIPRNILIKKLLSSVADHNNDIPKGSTLRAFHLRSKLFNCTDASSALRSDGDVDLVNLTHPSWNALFGFLRSLKFIESDDLIALEKYYWQTHPPVCRQSTNVSSKVFFFGVTYPENHKLAAAAHRTWGRLLPNMTWFTTPSPGRRPEFPAVVLQTARSTIGAHRADMIARLLAIWAYVFTVYGSGFDWFVRCWDRSEERRVGERV
eukprot:RCo002788